MTAGKNEQQKCTAALWQQYHGGSIPVIPDIKCQSPGEGDLLLGRDPVTIAQTLADAGAPVISVVTEADHYGGSLVLLQRIAAAISVPILRKDFITTVEDIQETLDYGGSGVLLIASMLDKKQLFTLVEAALHLHIEPLVETHSPEELLAVHDLPSTFIGINNRNIKVWETDDGSVATTEQLSPLVRPGVFLLSESAIATQDDVRRAMAAGAHGVLVGTAILRASDPVTMYHHLASTRLQP